MPQQNQDKYETDPTTSTLAAYRVAAFPEIHSVTQQQKLFDRGFASITNRAQESDNVSLKEVIRSVGSGIFSGAQDYAQPVSSISGPGELALASAMAILGIKSHDQIGDGSLSGVLPIERLGTQYGHTLIGLLNGTEYREPIITEMGTQLYEKETDGDAPIPGRVCDGLYTDTAFGEGEYLKIPLPAASKQCLVYADTEDGFGKEYDPDTKSGDGLLISRLGDNAVWVPWPDCKHTYLSHIEQSFTVLSSSLNEHLSDEDRNRLMEMVDFLEESVDRIVRTGHWEKLYANHDPHYYFSQMVKRAIRASDILKVGSAHTAAGIYRAIQQTEFEDSRIANVDKAIGSKKALAAKLTTVAPDSSKIAIVDTDEDESQKYRYGPRHKADFRQIQVDELEDLFQLPCFANLDERLKTEGPVRKDLFPFVSNAAWLPQYRGNNGDVDVDSAVEDFKEMFSERYHWYKPDVTEYQVRYEMSQGSVESDSGEELEPLPRGCDHESMQRYCIGKDVCPYSIYHSINWDQDLWTELESRNTSD